MFLRQMQVMTWGTSPAKQDHITGKRTNPEWQAARWLNFLGWCLIFVGPQYETCFMSPLSAPKILRFVTAGGPGNSLDRNYSEITTISQKRTGNCIVERTTNTTLRSVNLLKRHKKPWINKSEINLHLWLDQALMGLDVPHEGVNDMTAIWKRSVQYMA